MSAARAVLGLLLLGLTAWVLELVFSSPEAEATPTTFTSSKQCAECHATVFAEWEASWHAKSWTDTEVRALSSDFSNQDCIDCHAPRPVFETGIGQRVLPRAVRRIEGVDCIACHQTPDGQMAGTITKRSAACRPVERSELVRPEFCAGCHDQHGTVQQWKASRFAVAGEGYRDCLACHMPYRNGDPSLGRDHVMHGGHSLEMLRAAVEMRAERSGGGWRIEVENVGAGHNYPTDERSRASDLMWRPQSAGAEPAKWRPLYRFRNPYRHEIGLPNTELPAGEKVNVTIDASDIGEAGGAIEVVLFYKLSPYFVDPVYDLSPYYLKLESTERLEDAVSVHRLILEP